jgi:hypothetical protein
MSRNVILWDTRLEGTIKVGHLLGEYAVNQDTSLGPVLHSIAHLANTRGLIETLFVACHGYGEYRMKVGSLMWWIGGGGLQLGKEELHNHNYTSWRAIRNSVKNIVILACGPAGTAPEPSGSDGKFLMSSLARTTNAVVYGADTLQWYTLKNMDFGKWEGTLYCFLPTGQYFAVPGQIADGLAVHSE